MTGQDISKLYHNLFKVGGNVADQAVWNLAPKLCTDALSSPEVQNLYDRKFDLIMINEINNDCFMDLAENLQVVFLFNIVNIKNIILSFCYTN